MIYFSFKTTPTNNFLNPKFKLTQKQALTLDAYTQIKAYTNDSRVHDITSKEPLLLRN